MNSFPKQEQIVESVLKGINVAQLNYSSWIVHDLYLSYAPTNYLSIHVAQELAKIEHAPEIFMDASISDILKSSLQKKDSYRWFMAENNITQDVICLTLDERFEHQDDNDSISRVIMSIRNGVRNAQSEYIKDIEVMCKMLQKEKKEDSSLDYGLFAFYLDLSNTARKKSKKRIDEIIETFDQIVSSYKNLQSNFKGGEIHTIDNVGEWCVGCYIIEPTFNIK